MNQRRVSLYFKSFFFHTAAFIPSLDSQMVGKELLCQQQFYIDNAQYLALDHTSSFTSATLHSLSVCHHKGSSPLLASYLISDRQETHGGNDLAGAFDLISHESSMRIILNVSISKGSLCIAGGGCSCWDMIKAYYGNKPETTARFCCSCCCW
jgi:hypothetical protein